MLILNYRDAKPLYSQIKDGLRSLIVAGALGPDEKLPSVRALAADLAINPNTIQRAYADLEAEGFIYSLPGKGSFAAGLREAMAPRRQALLEKLLELVAELRYLGVTDGELVELIKEGSSQ